MQSHLALFAKKTPKKRFPSIFGNHLEFFGIKCKQAYISEMLWDRAISMKFLASRAIWHLLPEIVFPLKLAAILKFCVKCTIHLSWKRCEMSGFDKILAPRVCTVIWHFFFFLILFYFFILFYCILHVSKFFYIKAKIVI